MSLIDLTEEQAEEIESRLSEFDEKYITYRMDGSIRIGIEEDGKLIAGLDACITAFRILYVSTVFVTKHTGEKSTEPGSSAKWKKGRQRWASIPSGSIPSTGREKISTRRWDTQPPGIMKTRTTAIPNISL